MGTIGSSSATLNRTCSLVNGWVEKECNTLIPGKKNLVFGATEAHLAFTRLLIALTVRCDGEDLVA